MSRSRTVHVQPQNGGRHCPSLQQRRGCQVSSCNSHQDHAIKEIAILLPGFLSHSRKANITSDIRRNLRVGNPQEHPEYDPEREYCVEFEVLRASKACRKEEAFGALKEGERLCVRCESEALHKSLGWRCQGHGVEGRVTRWSAFSAPHCHGKWLRARPEPDKRCLERICSGNATSFIFV